MRFMTIYLCVVSVLLSAGVTTVLLKWSGIGHYSWWAATSPLLLLLAIWIVAAVLFVAIFVPHLIIKMLRT